MPRRPKLAPSQPDSRAEMQPRHTNDTHTDTGGMAEGSTHSRRRHKRDTPHVDDEAIAKAERRARRRRRKWLARWVADRWLYVSRHRFAALRAVGHANAHLMKKVFEEWNEVAWHARHGWRMEVTADVHYKVYLMRRYFRGWLGFIALRHCEIDIEHRKEAVADLHFQRVAWRQWRVFIDECRAENQHEMDRVATAVQYWAASSERRAIVAWKRYILQRRAKKRQIAIADDFHTQNLRWNAWVGWLERMEMQRKMKDKEKRADDHRNYRLLAIVWDKWRNYLENKHSEGDRVDAVQEIVLRSGLNRWRNRLQLVLKIRQLTDCARDHDHNRLLKLGFNSLKAAVLRRRRKIYMASRAVAFSSEHCMRLAFSQWRSTVMAIMAQKEVQAIVMADAHHECALRSTALRFWHVYCIELKHRRQKLAVCLARHDTVIVRACFAALKRHVHHRQNKARLVRQADDLRARQLALSTCNMWRLWTDLRHRERLVAAIDRRAVLSHVLKLWYDKRLARTDHRQRVLTAEEEGQHRFLRYYVRQWEAFTSYKLMRDDQRRVARKFDYIRILGTCFGTWVEFALEKGQKKDMLANASIELTRSFLRRVLHGWRMQTWMRLAESRRLEQADMYYNTRIAMQSWAAWRAYVSVKRDETLQMTRAVAYDRLVTLSDVVGIWQNATRQSIARREAENHTVLLAKIDINKSKLHRAFIAWLDWSQQQFLARVAMSRATLHHRSTILLKTLLAWYKYSLYRKHKEALISKSVALSRQLVLRRSFVVWRSEYNNRIVHHYQTWVAIRFWASMRKRHALNEWIKYHQHWKQKRAEIRTAMKAHDRFLRSEGLIGLVSGAAHLRSRRLAAAQVVAADDVKRVWRTVERIARHWRRKTLDSKRRREAAIMAAEAPKVSLGRVAGVEVTGPPTIFARYQQARPPVIQPKPSPSPSPPSPPRPVDIYARYVPPPRLRPAPRRPALLDPSLAPIIEQAVVEEPEVESPVTESSFEPEPLIEPAVPEPSTEDEIARLAAVLYEQQSIIESHQSRQEERDALSKLLSINIGDDGSDIEARIKELDEFAVEFEATRVDRMTRIQSCVEKIQLLKMQCR